MQKMGFIRIKQQELQFRYLYKQVKKLVTLTSPIISFTQSIHRTSGGHNNTTHRIYFLQRTKSLSKYKPYGQGEFFYF